MRGLNEDRAIPIDDPQECGVDALTPTMYITAIREHYEQLRRDITEDGQSINKDLDKFGANPSGVTLKFMYASLDLKCDAMETQFAEGFDQLIYFVDRYLSELGNQTTTADVDAIFTRNMKINESEAVDSCTKSQNLISKRTLLAHHPYVTDVEEELDELSQETQDERVAFDNIPLEDLMPPAGDAAADVTGGDDGES
ncbi:phage portal protein [Eubacterium aggregans]|uniref:phage portal protein n=1 Tax=Eubacterium aggregans TaxID=81409 RepID=UPI003F2E3052